MPGDYAGATPITFIADFVIRTKFKQPPVCHPVKFQLIGLNNGRQNADFTKYVIDRFDISCVQFAIEDPNEPDLVRSLNDNVMSLFSRHQFMYHMKRFTNIESFCSRTKKYLCRDFMFVGLTLDDDYTLHFENALLHDKKYKHCHNGDASSVSPTLDNIDLSPGNMCTVHKGEGKTINTNTCGEIIVPTKAELDVMERKHFDNVVYQREEDVRNSGMHIMVGDYIQLPPYTESYGIKYNNRIYADKSKLSNKYIVDYQTQAGGTTSSVVTTGDYGISAGYLDCNKDMARFDNKTDK